MISKDKERLSLLFESFFQMRNNYHFHFCNPETAFCQTNVNKFCVIALFRQNAHDIKTFCKQTVVLDQKLPNTKYLPYGIWIVVTGKPLTFTLNCQSYEPKIGDIKVAPPFGIIKLNNTCKTSNKYLQLPEYFGKYSHFERSDPLQILLKLHNVSQFSILNDSKAEFEKFRPISSPSHLSGLKEIPLQSFLFETRAYKMVNNDDNQNNNGWTFVAIVIVASVLAVIVIVWLIARKRNCYLT